jgi:hypothetical protein
MALTAPPWTKPCCCEISGWGRSTISTMPGETPAPIRDVRVLSPGLRQPLSPSDRTDAASYCGHGHNISSGVRIDD